MIDSEASSSPPAVRVRGLVYRYPDGEEALRGVNLEVQSGHCVALVGPNGAGKSTLLLHLNGLLPGRQRDEPGHHHGFDLALTARNGRRPPSVWIDGIEVSPRTAYQVRRKVGLLFQDPDDQLFGTTVLEDVAFGPLNQGQSSAQAKDRALECLERVELRHLAHRPPHHLSFGERKRVCLAGVLACQPSVLVLDEPTANLDPRGRRRFIELIQSLSITTLVATHDLELVLEICSRAILLDQGIVVADGPSREVLGNAALVAAHGLELPISLSLPRPS
jgi:energy-coupling factor transporter ATP-binding protein EcfA2